MLISCGESPLPSNFKSVLQAADGQLQGAEATKSEIALQGAPTVIDDPDAEDGTAVWLVRSGDSLSWTYEEAGATLELLVRARGEVYQGPPKMKLSVGGKVLGTQIVNTEDYALYTFGVHEVEAGAEIKLTFTNDLWGGSRESDRNLVIDYVTLQPADSQDASPTEPAEGETPTGSDETDPLPTEPVPVPPDLPGINVWLEAQEAVLDSPMLVGEIGSATGNHYAWVPDAPTSTREPPQGGASFSFSIAEAGTFSLWGRFYGERAGSFWIRVDEGDWLAWDGVVAKSFWSWDLAKWKKEPHTFDLEAGEHSLELRHRESGVRVDRLLFTSETDFEPKGRGADTFDERFDGLRRFELEIPFDDEPEKSDGHRIWFHPVQEPRCVIYTWITPSNVSTRLPDISLRNGCAHINRYGGDGKTPGRDYMIAAFAEAERLSGFEIAGLPRVLMGASRGTNYAAQRALEEPELTIAVVSFAGFNGYPKVEEFVYRENTYCGLQDKTPHTLDSIPTVAFVGEHDAYYDDEYDDGPDSPGKSPNYILRNTLHGLRQGLTTVLIEPGTGHTTAKASHEESLERSFIDAYLDAVISARMPETPGTTLPLTAVDRSSGWRGWHRGGWNIQPAVNYELPTGAAAECWADQASWLPNEETAQLWQGVWQVQPFGPYMTEVLQP